MLSGLDTQRKLKPLYIDRREYPGAVSLGVLELSTDEQLCKKIFEATGDKTFKGFLPLTWRTQQITRMKDARQRIQAEGKPLTAFNMAMKLPDISQAAHQYFITNADKITGFMDKPQDLLKPIQPLLWIAGIGVAAYLLSQLKPIIQGIKKP